MTRIVAIMINIKDMENHHKRKLKNHPRKRKAEKEPKKLHGKKFKIKDKEKKAQKNTGTS